MALPVSGIFAAIPWGTVIKNTPMIVEKARGLWNAITKDNAAMQNTARAPSPVQDHETLHQQLAALKADVKGLHTQVTRMGELVVQLTEQNAALVQRVERNRILLGATMAVAIASIGTTIYALL